MRRCNRQGAKSAKEDLGALGALAVHRLSSGRGKRVKVRGPVMQDTKPSVQFALLAAGLLALAGCDLTGQSTNPNGAQPQAKGPLPVAASDDPLLNTQLPPTGLAPLP